MDYPKMKKVIEIDQGDIVEELNKKLSEGWLLLCIRKYRRAMPDDEFREFAIYVLGLPSE